MALGRVSVGVVYIVEHKELNRLVGTPAIYPFLRKGSESPDQFFCGIWHLKLQTWVPVSRKTTQLPQSCSLSSMVATTVPFFFWHVCSCKYYPPPLPLRNHRRGSNDDIRQTALVVTSARCVEFPNGQR